MCLGIEPKPQASIVTQWSSWIHKTSESAKDAHGNKIKVQEENNYSVFHQLIKFEEMNN